MWVVLFLLFLCIDTHRSSSGIIDISPRPAREPTRLGHHLIFPLQHVDIAPSATLVQLSRSRTTTRTPLSPLCMTVHYLNRRLSFFFFLVALHLMGSYTPPAFFYCRLRYHHLFLLRHILHLFDSDVSFAVIMLSSGRPDATRPVSLRFVIWSLAHGKKSGWFDFFGCVVLICFGWVRA